MNLLKYAVLCTVTILSSIFYGFTVKQLWAWFVVPVFGLPQLGIVQALGIVLLIGVLMPKDFTKKPEDVNTVWLTHLFYSAICLGLGYFYTLFL